MHAINIAIKTRSNNFKVFDMSNISDTPGSKTRPEIAVCGNSHVRWRERGRKPPQLVWNIRRIER